MKVELVVVSSCPSGDVWVSALQMGCWRRIRAREEQLGVVCITVVRESM